MSKVQIFVEGIADQKFLQDLIEEWYVQQLKLGDFSKPHGDIIQTQGKDVFTTEDKLNKLKAIFEFNRVKGVQTLVIFDADTYAETHAYISSVNEAQNFDFFLFPNNESDGDLEILLENIINPTNRAVFDCWQNYEECLSPNFTTPARKTKIYAYLEAILGESKSQKEQIKEIKRDYRNTAHWVLDSDQMTILQPLKLFLDNYFL